MTLVGESLNDLADPRLRTRRAAAQAAGAVGAVTVVPGGVLLAGGEGIDGLDLLEGTADELFAGPTDDELLSRPHDDEDGGRS